MILIDMVVIALAAYSVADVWFNSDLFAWMRSDAEAWHDHPELHPWWFRWLGGSMGLTVLSCRFCFSFWAAIVCTCLFYVDHIGGLIIVALGAQRILWFTHELMPKRARLDRLQPDLDLLPPATTNESWITVKARIDHLEKQEDKYVRDAGDAADAGRSRQSDGSAVERLPAGPSSNFDPGHTAGKTDRESNPVHDIAATVARGRHADDEVFGDGDAASQPGAE